MAAKHLFAASDSGLFEALGEGPTDSTAWPPAPGSPPERPGSAPTPWSRWICCSATATIRQHPDGRRVPRRRFARPTCGRCCGSGTRSASRHGRSSPAPSARGRTRHLRPRPRLQSIAAFGIEAFTAAPSLALPEVVTVRQSSAPRHRRWHRLLVHRCGRRVAERERDRDRAAGRRPDRPGAHHLGGTGRTHRAFAPVMPCRRAAAGFDTFLVANLVHYWSPEHQPLAAATYPGRGRAPAPGC